MRLPATKSRCSKDDSVNWHMSSSSRSSSMAWEPTTVYQHPCLYLASQIAARDAPKQTPAMPMRHVQIKSSTVISSCLITNHTKHVTELS